MESAPRRLVQRWWRNDDQFGWVSSYLASRNLRRFTQLVVAFVIASFGLVTLSISLSPAGTRGSVGDLAAAVVVASCLIMAVLWLLRWPSRGQSGAFAVASTVCIAVACAIDHERQAGLMGCVAFAVIGGYVALLHTARLMVPVVAAAATTTFGLAADLVGQHPDLVLAAGRMTLTAMTMLAFPLIVQALMLYLIDDANRSDVDPLSGLLNRRGFDRAAARLLDTRPRAGDRYLGLAMIDLDDFKSLNDSRGHAVGDRALIAVGEALMRNSRDGAIVARAGGEEFFVADTYPTPDVTDTAERLRHAIAGGSFGVTASVGVATAPLPWPHRRRAVVDELIDAADAAMYEAKRAGGNRTRQSGSRSVDG